MFHPLLGTERENWYLLVVGQLNLGPGGDNPEIPTADEDTFWNPQMAAIFPRSTRAISYRGATVKELNE